MWGGGTDSFMQVLEALEGVDSSKIWQTWVLGCLEDS